MTPAIQHGANKGNRGARRVILGPNGRPARESAGYLYPSPARNRRKYRPRFSLSADTRNNVSAYDRREMVDLSRQLRSQIDELNTAIREKNNWAFGDAWDAHYVGAKSAWGEEAEEFLKRQFYPMANVRGKLFHFKRSLKLSGQAWDVDGDDLMVLTESPSGFPQIAFYPSTRIGNGWKGVSGDNLVQGGPFDGAKIYDGVIVDRNSRMIGVRVLNEDETYSDISSFNCDLAYEPEWGDQGRGIPRVAVSLLRWMDVQDIDDFLRAGIKRAASIGVKFKTPGGEAGLGNEIITSEEESAISEGDGTTQESGSKPPKLYMEEIEGGEAYYLDSESGEEVEAFEHRNPHPNTEAFIARLTRGSLAAVGWAYELLNLNATGRSPSRLVCDLANQSIWDRQSAGELRAYRAVSYAIAKAMKSGYLSRNDDGIDPYLWEFGFPAELSVDAGNDEAADRENLKLGTTSKTIIAQKRGWHRRDILRHRKTEIIENSVTAAEIEKETGGKVSFDKALEMLEQRGPNPVAQGAGKAHTEGTKGTKAP